MGFFSQFKGILASHNNSIDNNDLFFPNVVVNPRSTAGERITETSSLTLSPYFAGLRAISEDIAKLPLLVFEKQGRGKKFLPDNNIFKLLSFEPNKDSVSVTFRTAINYGALGWGNGYAEIVRDGEGTPTALWPIHPSRVRPIKNEDCELFYDVFQSTNGIQCDVNNRTTIIRFRAEDILHIVGPGFDGLTGLSILRFSSESLGLGLAAQKFGAAFFGNGTHINGVLMHPESLSSAAMQRLRDNWVSKYQGAANAVRPAILEEGMKWERIGIPPEEAQFLQTREFQVEDIARWFRIPPHKIGAMRGATFSNIEQQSIEYVQDTLQPWFARWEQEIKKKLFFEDEENLFAEHDVMELTRGDTATRGGYYRNLMNLGALKPNEIRTLENFNPIEDEAGELTYMQSNMATLSSIAREGDGTEENTGHENNDDDDSGHEDNDDDDSDIENETNSNQDESAIFSIYKPIFIDCSKRIINKEIKAVSRSIKKYNSTSSFSKWAGDFYINQYDYMMNEFDSVSLSFATSLLKKTSNTIQKNDLMDFCRTWIDKGIKRSLVAFSNAFSNNQDSDLKHWEESIESMADDAMETVKNAIT